MKCYNLMHSPFVCLRVCCTQVESFFLFPSVQPPYQAVKGGGIFSIVLLVGKGSSTLLLAVMATSENGEPTSYEIKSSLSLCSFEQYWVWIIYLHFPSFFFLKETTAYQAELFFVKGSTVVIFVTSSLRLKHYPLKLFGSLWQLLIDIVHDWYTVFPWPDAAGGGGGGVISACRTCLEATIGGRYLLEGSSSKLQ